jgi:hypothetical protein
MPETVEEIMEETVENALTALRRGFQQMESEYGKLDSN